MNTVGPYHNRQETYGYFTLPFCHGTKSNIDHYHETLSEALQGIELEFSGIEIEFKSKYFDYNKIPTKFWIYYLVESFEMQMWVY